MHGSGICEGLNEERRERKELMDGINNWFMLLLLLFFVSLLSLAVYYK
jgi:hypothetical protein